MVKIVSFIKGKLVLERMVVGVQSAKKRKRVAYAARALGIESLDGLSIRKISRFIDLYCGINGNEFNGFQKINRTIEKLRMTPEEKKFLSRMNDLCWQWYADNNHEDKSVIKTWSDFMELSDMCDDVSFGIEKAKKTIPKTVKYASIALSILLGVTVTQVGANFIKPKDVRGIEKNIQEEPIKIIPAWEKYLNAVEDFDCNLQNYTYIENYDYNHATQHFPWVSKYKMHIDYFSKKHDLSQKWIIAKIETESEGRPGVTSRKGCKGLMQINPKSWGIKNPYHPRSNIAWGTYAMNWGIKSFQKKYPDKPEIINDIRLQDALYNAGYGNVTEWINDDIWDGTIESIPFKETKNYVLEIAAHMAKLDEPFSVTEHNTSFE